VRTGASGYSAYLWGFQRFYGTPLSAAYWPVLARLQYGCSKRSSRWVPQPGSNRVRQGPAKVRPGHLGLLGFVAHGDERSPPKVTARKRAVMALTCSGTSSWQKCPDLTVLPYRI
jgi:hypothetical protein